jgi:hypothetical protein
LRPAKLAKVNGKAETSAYYRKACSPAQYQSDGYPLEKAPGNGVVCGLSVGLAPNTKSIVIDFTTNKCLPADAIEKIKGPSGACKS